MNEKYYCEGEGNERGICMITHNRCRVLDVSCEECMIGKKYEMMKIGEYHKETLKRLGDE